MKLRRGDTMITGFVLATLILVASLGWLHASAAARPQLRRGVPRSQARALARSTWQQVSQLVVRGQPTREALTKVGDADPGVSVEVTTLSDERLEVWIRVEVADGPERIGHALRVRAKVDSRGGWWVVDWHEVAG